jgi:2-polyprenyl-3-methyl-5-hydroxy-6-metoxy-1,4-benzoquinol methylase
MEWPRKSAKPLSIRLREMWQGAAQAGISSDECAVRQQREIEEYAAVWKRALLLSGQEDMALSTLTEIGRWRGIDDLAAVRRRCQGALDALKQRWEQTIQTPDARQVETYYDGADDCIEELMWWHTLSDDNSPLAYVAALEFAALEFGSSARNRSYLDFGSGVGSGALLFRTYEFDVTLADISSVMLAFCKHRFAERRCAARFIDLKESKLPAAAFDFVTAMDVFEHLVDPPGTVDALATSLKPGGYVYGRFAAGDDHDRPSISCKISAQFSIVSRNWASSRSFKTNGSGVIKRSKKLGEKTSRACRHHGCRYRRISMRS